MWLGHNRIFTSRRIASAERETKEEREKNENLVKRIIANDANNLKAVIRVNQSLKDTCKYRLISDDYEENRKEDIPKTSLGLIHIAAYYNSLECLMTLVNAGVDINLKSAGGFIPLHYACANGSIETGVYLLNHGANVSAVAGDEEFDSLYYCAMSGSAQLMELLFNHNAVLNDKVDQRSSNSPLNRSLRGKHFDCLEVLLRRGFKPNTRDGELTPLMQAITNYLCEAVEPLLKNGADPNYTNQKKNNAIIFATRQNRIDVVRTLLKYGAKVDCADASGQSLIHIACEKGNLEMVKLLVNHGADLHARDNKGALASFRVLNAKLEDMIPLLEYLNDNGIDFNDKDNTSNTIIYEIIPDSKRATPEVFEFLLSRGARLDIRIDSGKNAYELIKCLRRDEEDPLRKIAEKYWNMRHKKE